MEAIEQAYKIVEQVQHDLLFNEDLKDGVLDTIAEQELLQGLALLEAAQRCLEKANIWQVRALATSPYRQ